MRVFVGKGEVTGLHKRHEQRGLEYGHDVEVHDATNEVGLNDHIFFLWGDFKVIRVQGVAQLELRGSSNL